jgi:hypothetical protein
MSIHASLLSYHQEEDEALDYTRSGTDSLSVLRQREDCTCNPEKFVLNPPMPRDQGEKAQKNP